MKHSVHKSLVQILDNIGITHVRFHLSEFQDRSDTMNVYLSPSQYARLPGQIQKILDDDKKARVYKMLREEVGLSKAEAFVIEGIMDGGTNHQVAAKLFVSEKTVRFHCSASYKKLKVKNKETAILKVAELIRGLK